MATRSNIKALRREAAEARDYAQVSLCDRALAGDVKAHQACQDVIAGVAKYSVNLWGSRPSQNNDDCETGDDTALVEEARDWYRNPRAHFSAGAVSRAAFIELVSPDGTSELRRNSGYVPPTADDDSDWAAERAMQAGMAFGAAGYNDSMGWG